MFVNDQHSFCESVTASAISPWCIRPLTEKGRKCGGAVDTASLCGRVRVGHGWDLNVPVDLRHTNACIPCVAVIDRAVHAESQSTEATE